LPHSHAQMHAVGIVGKSRREEALVAPSSGKLRFYIDLLSRVFWSALSIGAAMRDFATCTNRLILTLALSMATATACADGDPSRGKVLFKECAACHSLEPGVHVLGPSLYGVFNRQAGELADYRYSRALKRSGIIWTADTLDAFIANSQQFLPANRMPYSGMPDSANRADLMAYLQQMLK
jgi:cytochrome c